MTDDTVDEEYEAFLESLTLGMSKDEAEKYISKRRNVDTFAMNKRLFRGKVWTYDSTVKYTNVVLAIAGALEKLNRRTEACFLLRHGRFMEDDAGEEEMGEARRIVNGEEDCWEAFDLALAKLCFKSGENEEATKLIEAVISEYERRKEKGTLLESSCERASDAYYLAGWIAIHQDDHTTAYEWWKRGCSALKGDVNLERQNKKRTLWDDAHFDVEAHAADLEGIFGAAEAAQRTFSFDRSRDFDAFAVSGENVQRCAALRLFDPELQNNELVFRTRVPLMTPDECKTVVDIAEKHIRDDLDGTWGTVRAASCKTTDFAVEEVPELRVWLKALMQRCLFPMLAETFPRLADGSSIIDENGQNRMRLHDAFIVRYDTKFGSLHLPEHFDTSSMSFTVTLNDGFEGGGTWFETLGDNANGQVVDGDVGHAVAFAGPLKHSGFPIRSGNRMILVLFCYVENFSYGKYLRSACEVVAPSTNEPCTKKGAPKDAGRPSGDDENGFVVYRQTVELASVLDKANV